MLPVQERRIVKSYYHALLNPGKEKRKKLSLLLDRVLALQAVKRRIPPGALLAEYARIQGEVDAI